MAKLTFCRRLKHPSRSILGSKELCGIQTKVHKIKKTTEQNLRLLRMNCLILVPTQLYMVGSWIWFTSLLAACIYKMVTPLQFILQITSHVPLSEQLLKKVFPGDFQKSFHRFCQNPLEIWGRHLQSLVSNRDIDHIHNKVGSIITCISQLNATTGSGHRSSKFVNNLLGQLGLVYMLITKDRLPLTRSNFYVILNHKKD